MADALHQVGLKAAISRNGLLETQEAKLVLACLKFLLTPSDALAAAEILFLTGSMDLQQIVNRRLEYLAKHREGSAYGGEWVENVPILEHLRGMKSRTADLSASEILNFVLEELDLRRAVVQLGNPDQRLDNLDRLRRYALDYESACQRLHSAASLGGFLLWLQQLADQDLDAQGSGESDDAVKVLTYHRSKGLEYPVTICHALEQSLKEQIWGLNLVSETDKPDLNNILGNRWLRFWVNPYADQYRNTPLQEAVEQTDAFFAARRVALEEEARLLYVGITRARDYLVFPTTVKGTGWLNRVFSRGDESIPTLDPHSDETPFYHGAMPLRIDTEVCYKPKDFPEHPHTEGSVQYHAERKGRRPSIQPNLWIDPLREMPSGMQLTPGEPEVWSPWLEFRGDYVPEISKALTTFMLADRPGLREEDRLFIASKQMEIRRLKDQVTAEQLLRQSAAFHTFIQQKFAPSRIIAHYNADASQGERLLKLEADLFLETPSGQVILHFAPFAEGMKKWKQTVQHASPLLAWWQVVMQGKIGAWVVFPVEGQVVKVDGGRLTVDGRR
jgi:ATP-dependent helicase/nuclease subunit A